MKSKLIIVLVIICSSTSILFSQTVLPKEFKVFQPEYFTENNTKWSKQFDTWQDYAMQRIIRGDFGKPRNKTVWAVYSDRASNTTYSTPSNSQSFSSLDFMERVYIAEIKNGYALVFTDEHTSTFERGINATAISKGWVHVENLLLWEKCPQNENSIFQKGLVVGDPEKSTTLVTNPPYLKAPLSNATENGNAFKLDILFIMKRVKTNNKNYYLLSKEMNVNKRKAVVYGWLPEEYITPWDQRLCIEPTTASASYDFYRERSLLPSIFKEIKEAQNFYSNSTQGVPFWIYRDFNKTRMNANIMRSPLLNKSGTDIYKVASIASVEKRGPTPDDIQEIERLKLLMENINVILVIDATSSMKNYYAPVANALRDVMGREWESKKIKVGVVLYRNAADGIREVEFLRATDNINAAINFIAAADPASVGKTHYESLFKGLDTALDTRKMGYDPKHSNFMIVIGDAGNEGNPDIDNFAKKMAQNRINLLSFQVNHSNSRAYDVFATQMGNLVKKTIEGRNATDIEYVRKKNRLYIAQRKSSKSPSFVYGGFKFANPGKSEPTSDLKKDIVDVVKEFASTVENTLNDLTRGSMGFGTDGSADVERVKEILKEFGWSDARIRIFLETGVVSKLIGYAPIKIQRADLSIFDYVLFFSLDELKEIIKELKKLESNSNIGNRKAYQDAIIAMGQAFLGQMSADEIMGMSMDQLTAQIYGVPVPISNCGVKIVDIIDKRKISDNQLQDYINDFNTKRRGLENIVNNPYNGKFISNGITYIWVPFTNMPGYCAE